MKQKSLKKNAFLNILKTVLTLFFPLITFPYSSRILGPDNLGKVNFAQSIVSYFAMLASLGITTYATREAAKLRDRREELSRISSEIFIINMIATIIAYILLAISLVFVKKFEDYILIILICSSLIMFTTLGMAWLYQAVEDYFYITMRSLVFQVISVLLLFTLVKSKDDYLWYAAVNIISNVGANILNFFHARKYINLRISNNLNLKKHLKPIFILFAAAITSSIFASIDTTMLGFMSNDTEVGLYSAGMKLIHMINGLFPAIIIVVFPRVSYYFANNDEKNIKLLSAKTMNCLMGLSLPIAVGLYILMKPLVILFCGQKYLNAIVISQIMCPYLIFSGIFHFLGGSVLIARGQENIHLYTMLGASIVDIILNTFLINSYGAKGAAFATLLSQIVITIFDIIYLRTFISELPIKRSCVQFLVSAFVMGIAVYFTRNFFSNLFLQLFVPFVVGVLTYAIMLFTLRNQFFLAATNDIFKKLRRK